MPLRVNFVKDILLTGWFVESDLGDDPQDNLDICLEVFGEDLLDFVESCGGLETLITSVEWVKDE